MKRFFVFLLLLFPVLLYPKQTLLDAVKKGDLKFIESYKGDIDESLDKNGTTALIMASEIGNISVIKALLKLNADIDYVDNAGKTALMFASEKGNADAVRVLISSGADVEAVDKDENNPLMYASQKGNTNIIHQLIEAGAKVFFQNKNGYTALMIAAKNGKLGAVQVLIFNEADVNELTGDPVNNDYEANFNESALMIAAMNGHVEVVKELIKAGADLGLAWGTAKETILMFAAEIHFTC